MNLNFVIRIIEVFRKNLSTELTILQISKLAKMSYNATHRTVNYLIKQEILSSRKIGNSFVITFNKTPLSFGFLSLAESNKTNNFQTLLDNINKNASLFE
jgi:DNA-binding IclR family transcriptional regulator